MPHGRHIYAKAYEMEKAAMCANSQWKYILRCCAQCPSINIPEQETYDKHTNPSTLIRFQIYHMIARCKEHGRIPLTNKKSCGECQQNTASVKSTKIYTRKYLVMMETNISNFHTSYFIPEIHKLESYIPHVQILGTNHCGKSRQIASKRRVSFQDVLCRCDYAERFVASFSNQIKSEYYGGNRSMYIEVIVLEHFSALPQTEINAPTEPCLQNSVFHYFYQRIAKNMLPLLLQIAMV